MWPTLTFNIPTISLVCTLIAATETNVSFDSMVAQLNALCGIGVDCSDAKEMSLSNLNGLTSQFLINILNRNWENLEKVSREMRSGAVGESSHSINSRLALSLWLAQRPKPWSEGRKSLHEAFKLAKDAAQVAQRREQGQYLVESLCLTAYLAARVLPKEDELLPQLSQSLTNLTTASKLSNALAQINLLQSLADVNSRLQLWESSEHSLEQALLLATQLGEFASRVQGELLLRKGNVFAEQKKYALAEAAYVTGCDMDSNCEQNILRLAKLRHGEAMAIYLQRGLLHAKTKLLSAAELYEQMGLSSYYYDVLTLLYTIQTPATMPSNRSPLIEAKLSEARKFLDPTERHDF